MIAETMALSGTCDARFDRVRDTVAGNFSRFPEIGARVCVVRRGEVVVDLWGGWRDAERTRAWDGDTVVNMFSATKGVMAGCFAMLVDRGLTTYDALVADHWPAFGVAGKGRVTVGMLLSHQAGVPGFADPATFDDIVSPAAADRLARQAPMWEPGTASGYHATSIGMLAEALFRRIEGRSVKRFVHDELKEGLGLDLSIGLAPERWDIAAPVIAPDKAQLPPLDALNPARRAAIANPSFDPTVANGPEWRAADLPSTNGHGHAGALARFYDRLIAPAGGLVAPATLAEATQVRWAGVDLVTDLPSRWAAGFLRNSGGVFGPSDAAFGHTGWGGSFGMADPDAGLAIAYTMNRMMPGLRDDPRANALIDATYRSL